ncbi:hypothetical protein KY320_00400 [Candidatus Woesearchaeota archaeon]|nr:hypothetical protein [Candidatus Woesearchaeota archaeon]
MFPLEFKIADIQVAITLQHNENFWHWQDMKDAVLLTVDAHNDTGDFAPYETRLSRLLAYITGETQFICSAVHYGCVSSVYWLNPHSESLPLQYTGDVRLVEGVPRLKTKVIEHSGKKYISWGEESQNMVVEPEEETAMLETIADIHRGIGAIVTAEQIDIPESRPFILDVDLDGFCCFYGEKYSPAGHDGISGWQKRIRETRDVLKQLREPDLITITRSCSTNGMKWVPPGLVDEVQHKFLRVLYELYDPKDTLKDWILRGVWDKSRELEKQYA